MGSPSLAANAKVWGLVAIASLLLANGAIAVSYAINTYTNPAVTGQPVSDVVTQLMSRWRLTISRSRLSTSQPSAAELASTNAYIIYAAGQGSYWNTEGLDSNSAKLSELRAWINSGGSLILVNGANDNTNTFLPLLSALVGSSSNCITRSFAQNTRIFRRFDPPSNFGNLPLKMFRYATGDAIAGLDCITGLPIYSSDSTKKLYPIAAAITWNVGRGAVTWSGADIVVDNQNPAALVVAAAVVVQPPLSPPTSPPLGSPQPTRSPPPRRPPPPPPPSPVVRSPPPARSPPPPPSPPPPRPPPPSPPPPTPPSPPPPRPPPPSPPPPSPPPPRPPSPRPPSPPPPPPPPSPPPPSPPPARSPPSPPPSRSSPPPPPTPTASPPFPSPPPRGRGTSPPPSPPTTQSPPPPPFTDYYYGPPPTEYYTPPPYYEYDAPPPPRKKATGRHH